MNQNTDTDSNEKAKGNLPPFDFFIDNEVPKQTMEKDKPYSIREFLNLDYKYKGVNDGYEFHSSDALNNAKNKIKSEFNIIIDQNIQDKRERKLQMQNLIVDVSGISDSASIRLENTILEMEISMNLLMEQKALSVTDKGWVMAAIYGYQQGFEQGLNDYIAGEELLNSIKNI